MQGNLDELRERLKRENVPTILVAPKGSKQETQDVGVPFENYVRIITSPEVSEAIKKKYLDAAIETGDKIVKQTQNPNVALAELSKVIEEFKKTKVNATQDTIDTFIKDVLESIKKLHGDDDESQTDVNGH
jgi:hypothetical protein